MYKLIKTKITGFDNIEDTPIGLNSNYRATMGYNDTNETINVTVEKIVRPDLTRDEEIEVSYETVAERTFTKADFVQTKDNMAWQVDFDVQTEQILAPLDVYAYTSTIATGSLFHRVMWRKIKERYSDLLLPLFTVDSFYKNADGFSLSTLQFHVADNPGELSDTIITNSDVEEMTQAEKISYGVENINTHVFYEIYDAEDNLLSSIINPCDHVQEAIAKREDEPAKVKGGNQYRVSLPNASAYKVKVLFYGDHLDKTQSARFDVVCINAVSNKTRLTSGIKPNAPTTYAGINRLDPHGNSRFAGSEVVTLTSNLDSGDYIKLKLSVGDFYSYSELWIDII